MKKIFFVIWLIMLILNACAPKPTAIPAPPTATKTPRPTATQTPTPTPETWVRGAENGTGIELPVALFDSIKDKNPILSADGEQILNAETLDLLLEKVDGEWQKVEQGVVGEAMSEYGMPEEQADKLADLEGEVSFEEAEKVNGVVIKENGKDVFYYSYQAEFLVAVDCWNQVTNAEQLSDNPVTGEELLSDEWYAWTEYLLSKTGKGIGPNTDFSPEKTTRGEMLDFAVSDRATYLLNYPGHLNVGVTYADLTVTINGEVKRYQVVVNGLEDEDGISDPVSLISEYAPDYMKPEKIVEHNQRFGSMLRSPIFTANINIWDVKDPFISSIYDKTSWVAAMDLLQKHGDSSLISKPGLVYLTMNANSGLIGN